MPNSDQEISLQKALRTVGEVGLAHVKTLPVGSFPQFILLPEQY